MLFMLSAPPSGVMSPALLEERLRRLGQGDAAAMEEVYDGTHAAVYGFALSLLKNAHDAEDVLQDTYLRVYQSASGYRAQGKPMAWILTITRNLSLSVLRGRQGGTERPFEDLEESFSTNPAFSPDDALALWAVLETLDAQERQLIMLHVLGGLKHRESAALLGLPLSTVLSKYTRALKKLKQALKEAE